jgi:septum formation protein
LVPDLLPDLPARPDLRISHTAPLVLGSGSPRRRELLAMLGVPVVVRAAAADETMRAGETPDAYLDRVTRAKLDAVRAMGARDAVAPVLVADTIVVSPRGLVLGKPGGDDEAQAMLEQLAGATHEVKTRFVLAASVAAVASAGHPEAQAGEHAETVATRVTFRGLAPGEARAYAEAGEGRDKAGAYAAQGRAAAFIERIDGSYTGIVGLPVCEVVVALRRLGWW